MIVCPKCGELAPFSTYFGAYICAKCNWKHESFNIDRATATTSGTYVWDKKSSDYDREAMDDKIARNTDNG